MWVVRCSPALVGQPKMHFRELCEGAVYIISSRRVGVVDEIAEACSDRYTPNDCILTDWADGSPRIADGATA